MWQEEANRNIKHEKVQKKSPQDPIETKLSRPYRHTLPGLLIISHAKVK